MYLLFKGTWLLLLFNLVFAVAELMNDFPEFRADDDTVKFNHIVLRVGNNEETIFIGGVNRLYQLTSDLTLIGNITTGPVMDSPECTINHCPIYAQKKLTNNYNKVLVIDKEASKLIACGNVFQGLCSLYDIRNMTNSRNVYQPVAATDADSSTVAFLGTRLQLKGLRREVLYVGVTRHSSDHEILPTVTLRDLDDNNTLNLIKNITLQRRDYLVNYVSGFNLGSFNYFLTTRRKSIDSSAPYVSKLVRICSEDVNFNSYTQIPIKCSKGDGEQYDLVQATFISMPAEELATSLGIQTSDDVLFAVFAQNKSNKLIKKEPDKPNEHSALCIYSLKAVNAKFTENIKNCHQGKGYLASEFASLNQKCTRTSTVINDEFCGSIENTPIDGEISLLASPVITFDRTLLTSIVVNLVSGQNVVYVGTNTGHVRKILLKSITNVSEMADISIDEGFPVNSDTLFDSKGNFLYVMTERRLIKLNLYECSEFKSCMDCLNAKSSFCGWCYTRNECCSQRRCNTSTSISDVPSWIQKTGGCILVSSITPTETLIETKTDVRFDFENLPRLGATAFICVFSFDGAESRSTDAVEKNYNVTCKTPDVSSLPKIPPGHQHITADLVLKTTTNFILARTNFFFFDCSLYTSCTACISRSSCNWCLNEHRCIYNKKENCIDGTVILNDQMSYCPRIKAVNNESEIIIPNLTKRNISVHFYTNLHTFKEIQFSCQFNVEGKLINKNAFLHNEVNKIECEMMEFTYAKDTPNMTVEFAVLWNNSIPSDNLDNIHIVLFKCNKMANDCVECLTMNTNHQCGWCKNDMNECTIKNQCHSKKSHWFGRTEICPDPVISRFWPKQGPLEGNTYITIQGENLGQRFEDLDNNITVANMSCKPCKDLYKPGKQIVCLIRNRSVEAEPVGGPVFIQVGNYSTTSNDFFKFVNPQVEDISPKRAPQSGGTELTIRGKNLNAGSRLEVFINDNLLCEVSSNTSSEMKCSISKSSKGPFKGSIAVKFDETLRYYEKDQFEYTEDPTIISIDGGNSVRKGPKSIPLGGATIFVDGTNFLSIQNPRFYIFDNNTTSNYSTCSIINDTRMTCASPHFEQVNSSSIDPSNPKVLGYGFKMDNVPALEHISSNTSYPRFLLYPNPTFKLCSIGNYLTIDGDNINFAFRINDVTVQIDNDSCIVTSLSETQIICRPPSSQIERYKENGDEDPPKVIIFMGANLRQTLEKLSYPPNHHIVLYKCNKMANDCVECLTLKTNHYCGWCINNMNQCTLKSQCHGEESHWLNHSRFRPKLGTSEESTKIQSSSESTPCPMIKAFAEGTEIFVSNGTIRNISFNILNINIVKENPDFFCDFVVERKEEREKAFIKGDTIECEAHKFKYMARKPHVTASLSVLWKHSVALSNPDNVSVIIFTCSIMATSFASCLSLDKKYKCGWCHEMNKPSCEIKDQCDINSGKWIHPNDPNFSLWPLLGPYEGGTNVTILSQNMEEILNDMNSSITIASEPCKILQKIKHERKIVCKTSNIGIPTKQSFPVIFNGANRTVVSFENFTFVNPKITDISIGPIINSTNGSRILTIKGKYMDAGNFIEVQVDDLPCIIIEKSSDEISCTMILSKELFDLLVIVKFDGNARLYQQRALPGNPSSTSQNNAFLYFGITAVIIAFSFVIYYVMYSRGLGKSRRRFRGIDPDTIALSREIKRITISKINQNNTSGFLELPDITVEYFRTQECTGMVSGNYELPLDDKWEFPRSKLILRNKLGEGEFGKVVQGEALGILNENVTTTVAVKMLKDIHSDTDMIDLVTEMEMMKLIGTHGNVLRLLGCCSQGGDLLIITEYAPYGNLQNFLRQQLPIAANSTTKIELSERTLTIFAFQIADGMEYLASKKCIHRDLASRNILVSYNYIMKIADFGLARDIRNKDYYKKTSDGRLPIKWMAPEALFHRIYTLQSDVWSYGILLWEIFTLGGVPYPSCPKLEKLIQALRTGYRMEMPSKCPLKIYSLMCNCWSYKPDDRPEFSEIVRVLDEMLKNNEVQSVSLWLNSADSNNEENEMNALLD